MSDNDFMNQTDVVEKLSNVHKSVTKFFCGTRDKERHVERLNVNN